MLVGKYTDIHTHTQEIPFSESLKALRAYSLSEIPETVELSLTVDMSLKKGKTREPFRGTLIYPHKFGVMRKILLIAEVRRVCYFRETEIDHDC